MTTSERARPPTATSAAEMDDYLRTLRAGAAAWSNLAVSGKIRILLACRDGVARQARRWTEAGARAKGILGTPLAGEEAMSGPWATLRALNRYVETLKQILTGGTPRMDPARVRLRPDGQVVADVFPVDFYDRALLNGIRAEVWMEPGVTPASLPQTMGTWYRQTAHEPRVALVLGAGNISSIGLLDVLYKLVAVGTVCILKLNPVNSGLGPIFEDAFRPLVEGGYLRLVYGDADAGRYLCTHPLVDEIHLTGSESTFDAIVFGAGPDGAQRKRLRAPLLDKPITGELGNVSPTIVVPGPWTDDDVAFQAENVVTQKLHNGGFNCVASQVLILPEDWDRTPQLIASIERVMREASDRPAYYPGAGRRRSALVADRTRAVAQFGRNGDGFVPRTVVRVDARDPNEAALTTEVFSSLLAIATLPGDVEAYLSDAVAVANERLRGTLGANVVVHPRTMRENAAALDRAVADLRYGCIGVNAWTGVGYLLCETPWGAYPGNTIDDVGSGIGVVHNARLFSRSRKSVVYAPFAPFPRSLMGYGNTLLPKPPWFVTNRNQAKIGQALCDFEAAKSPIGAAKIALLAMMA
jgi:aldehyde dehydrogenase (NAD(P)+)